MKFYGFTNFFGRAFRGENTVPKHCGKEYDEYSHPSHLIFTNGESDREIKDENPEVKTRTYEIAPGKLIPRIISAFIQALINLL